MTLRDYAHKAYLDAYTDEVEAVENIRFEVFGCHFPGYNSQDYFRPYRGNDLSSALTAFHKAETRLLADGDE